MNIDVVNYNVEDMDGYASADIQYIPGRSAEYLHASPVFVPVTACDSGFTLPGIVNMPKEQSKFSLKSSGIIAAEDSILFVFRGHMHGMLSMIKVILKGCSWRARWR